MIDKEVQKKIVFLQLHVKKLLRSLTSGHLRSKQKGYGLEFEQLRDYQLGDDVRYIDWKSSARTNKMLLKEYVHEHSKIILIAVDVSGSNVYGSMTVLKQEIIKFESSYASNIKSIYIGGKDLSYLDNFQLIAFLNLFRCFSEINTEYSLEMD